MKYSVVIPLLALLSGSMASMAAKVEYTHPEVTIVAVDEALDSVLKALGKEMQITVTVPSGINPTINCDIQNKPLERAIKTLLGDMSYSLVWADNGERLAGLVILAGDGEPAVAVAGNQQTSSPRAEVYEYDQSAETAPNDYAEEPRPDARDSEMETERLEMEARVAEDRAEREIEMEQKRQEEEIAHKARQQEEEIRHKAWMADYLETYGPKPTQ